MNQNKGSAVDALIAETRAAMEEIFGPDLDVSDIPSTPPASTEPAQKDGVGMAIRTRSDFLPRIFESANSSRPSGVRRRAGFETENRDPYRGTT